MSFRAFVLLYALVIAAVAVATFFAISVAVVALKDAARRGDLPVLTWGLAR